MGVAVKGERRVYFPKVKEAREALKERAIELFELQLDIIKSAKDKGEFKTAADANQWLIEHMPAEDGERMIDSSASKPKEIEGSKTPQIQIGIALGGMAPKELKPVEPTIEAEVVPSVEVKDE